MLKVQVDFLGGATVQIRAYIYDDADVLVDPTSAKVTITNPSKVAVVTLAAMTDLPATDGIYDYFYNTTTVLEKGAWSGVVEVVDGAGVTAKTTLAPFGFKVK